MGSHHDYVGLNFVRDANDLRCWIALHQAMFDQHLRIAKLERELFLQ